MALSRRDFLEASSLFALQATPAETGTIVNDIHSQLNPTRVRNVVSVGSATDLQRALRGAAAAAGVSAIEADIRSGRAFSERVVPLLQGDVRRPALSEVEGI